MTPTPRLIVGFSGYLRSGKDTAGNVLTEGHDFTKASFAAKLKDFLYALNPLIPPAYAGSPHPRLAPVVDAYGWEAAKDKFPEIRALLQRCGTDAGRKVLGANVWVDAAIRDLPDGDVVFTDVRFLNEALAIRGAGGVVVRVDRPGFEPGPDAHESETALDGFDFDHTIVNDGRVEDLRATVTGTLRLVRLTRELAEDATQAPAVVDCPA